MEYSKCCGAEPSYLNDELCGECLEHTDFAEFEDYVEDENPELTSEELKELMKIYYNN